MLQHHTTPLKERIPTRFDAQCAANELKVKKGSRSKARITQGRQTVDREHEEKRETQSFTRRLCEKRERERERERQAACQPVCIL